MTDSILSVSFLISDYLEIDASTVFVELFLPEFQN